MSDTWQGPRSIPDRSDDDGVAELLRHAGPRPAVPAQAVAQAKAAAHAAWQQTVRARRRQRLYRRGAATLLATAALLLLVFNTGLWRRLALRSTGPLATAEVILGTVQVWPAGDGDAAELRAGAQLPAGARVETAASDAPARAILQLAGGITLRLDTGSRLRLLSTTAIALDRGAVYVETHQPAPAAGSALEVHTPLGVARDLGTRFEVRLAADGEQLRLRVREGTVRLSGQGATHTATAGDQLDLQLDGTVTATQIPLHGPDWQWLLTIPTPFALEGQTLSEFLTWAAQEGGWQVDFADPALAEHSHEVILHGSIAQLSVEDAATLVLAGSGLGYRLENGVFLVVPASDGG